MPYPGRRRQRADHARGRSGVQPAPGELFLIPDILCNAGGVVVSYFEWVQDLQQLFWTEPEVRDRLNRILERSFQQVMHRVERDGVPHRTAAMAIGVEKVQRAKKTRGLFP